MGNPIPHVVSTKGAAGAAPSGSIPIALYGADGGATTVAWGDITGKPATLETPAAAGTASVRKIGTGATDAKAGNYVPTSAEVATGLRTKAQINALAAVSAANAAPAAADPVTKAEFDVLVTLANANKAAINAIIAALKA